MGTERKIEALREATDRKRQEALDKTNAAITRLLKEKKRINFPTVAKEAGVSVTYLYKYDDIKERINHLRHQQEKTIKKPLTPQLASDKSKQVILNQLRERVRQLEADNRELRNKNEVVYGRLYQLQSVQQEIEALKLENTILKTQNNCLQQQLDECHFSVKSQTTSTQPADSKVTSLEKKRTQRSDISDIVKSKLTEVGVQLNSTLTKTIKSTSVEFVLSAIQALKEAMANGNIERPGGWLNAAIKDGWKPNEKYVKKGEWASFNEWFNLAKKQGLIMASMKGDDDKLYVFTPDGTKILFDVMLSDYPLEKLKASL